MSFQIEMIIIPLPTILVLVTAAAILSSIVLWRKGKTVEALLILNALLQVFIIMLLLFKP